MDIFNAIGLPIDILNMQRAIHVKENYSKIEHVIWITHL